MTDKEIALELTKAYMEHLNNKVAHSAPKSSISPQDFHTLYKSLFQTVSSLNTKSQSQ
ncbi:TPA: hypothetical protein QCX89_003241 [Bacillus cereus]|nr:hypothetical protein [Bacillus cereus]